MNTDKQCCKSIPFTVIGGFLGAGKTTLVNHIITQSQGVRYAVMVNDFGELNIDQSLIVQHDGMTMALSNGCMCCSMAAGFSQGLGKILDRLELFDHIIVEASGVADPSKILDIAKVERALLPNGVIVMVDGAQVINHANNSYVGQSVIRQLKVADILLINKVDLVADNQLQYLSDWLNKVSLGKKSIFLVNAKAPLSTIFSVRGKNHPAQHATYTDTAEQTFRTVRLKSLTPIPRAIFSQWSRSLPDPVIRGKGLVRFTDKPYQLMAWHKIGEQIQLIELDGVPAEYSNACELILIGTSAMPSAENLGKINGLSLLFN